jgi:hypothetical protein
MQESNPETENNNEDYIPSHNMEGKYAVLAETNNQFKETWYYFIRHDTNIDALDYLYKQLDSIEWEYLENYSTFSLDLENLVSPQTAKELTKICINDGSSHRKFDGTLEFVHFEFRKKDNNIVRLIKICETIGSGNIENYIDCEDFDPEDYEDEEGEDEDEEGEDDSSSSSDSEEEEDDDDDDEEKEQPQLPKEEQPQPPKAKQPPLPKEPQPLKTKGKSRGNNK